MHYKGKSNEMKGNINPFVPNATFLYTCEKQNNLNESF